MSEELKPCPFCGSKAVENARRPTFQNFCCSNTKCGLTDVYFTPKEWNQRATDGQLTELQAHNAALREAIQFCIDEAHRINKARPIPQKFGAPFAGLNRLNETLTLTPSEACAKAKAMDVVLSKRVLKIAETCIRLRRKDLAARKSTTSIDLAKLEHALSAIQAAREAGIWG